MTTDGWLRSRRTMACASASSPASATALNGGYCCTLSLAESCTGCTPLLMNLVSHAVESTKSVVVSMRLCCSDCSRVRSRACSRERAAAQSGLCNAPILHPEEHPVLVGVVKQLGIGGVVRRPPEVAPNSTNTFDSELVDAVRHGCATAAKILIAYSKPVRDCVRIQAKEEPKLYSIRRTRLSLAHASACVQYNS